MNAVALKFLAEGPRSIPSRLLEAIPSPDSGVQIWIAHLNSISSIDMVELIAPLDATEHGRAAQFRFARDRQHYVAARGILRCLLGAALEVPASAIVFEYGAHGKPALVGDGPTLHFNISHAAGSAIFALASDRNLGIDLEASGRLVNDNADLANLAARVLSPHELVIWRTLADDGARASAFLRAWTRKEAYVKATGEGLGEGLQAIEVALDAANPERSLTLPCISGEKTTGNWTLYDLPSPFGFAAALAIEEQ